MSILKLFKRKPEPVIEPDAVATAAMNARLQKMLAHHMQVRLPATPLPGTDQAA